MRQRQRKEEGGNVDGGGGRRKDMRAGISRGGDGQVGVGCDGNYRREGAHQKSYSWIAHQSDSVMSLGRRHN